MKKALLLSAVVLALPLSVSFAGGMGNTQAANFLNRGTVNTTATRTVRYVPVAPAAQDEMTAITTTEGRTFYVPTSNTVDSYQARLAKPARQLSAAQKIRRYRALRGL